MSEGTNPIVEFFRGSIGKKLEGALPLTAWLDGRIVSCDPGKMEVRFVSRPEMANPTGLVTMMVRFHPTELLQLKGHNDYRPFFLSVFSACSSRFVPTLSPLSPV